MHSYINHCQYLNDVTADAVKKSAWRHRLQGGFISIFFAATVYVIYLSFTEPLAPKINMPQETTCKVEMGWGFAETHVYNGKIKKVSIK